MRHDHHRHCSFHDSYPAKSAAPASPCCNPTRPSAHLLGSWFLATARARSPHAAARQRQLRRKIITVGRPTSANAFTGSMASYDLRGQFHVLLAVSESDCRTGQVNWNMERNRCPYADEPSTAWPNSQNVPPVDDPASRIGVHTAQNVDTVDLHPEAPRMIASCPSRCRNSHHRSPQRWSWNPSDNAWAMHHLDIRHCHPPFLNPGTRRSTALLYVLK